MVDVTPGFLLGLSLLMAVVVLAVAAFRLRSASARLRPDAGVAALVAAMRAEPRNRRVVAAALAAIALANAVADEEDAARGATPNEDAAHAPAGAGAAIGAELAAAGAPLAAAEALDAFVDDRAVCAWGYALASIVFMYIMCATHLSAFVLARVARAGVWPRRGRAPTDRVLRALPRPVRMRRRADEAVPRGVRVDRARARSRGAARGRRARAHDGLRAADYRVRRALLRRRARAGLADRRGDAACVTPRSPRCYARSYSAPVPPPPPPRHHTHSHAHSHTQTHAQTPWLCTPRARPC